MIKTIKNKIQNNILLFENLLSLTSLQAVNYIIPIITLPYLVRVLGPEKYGLLAFAQAFCYYFILITDYGFNLSATRDISINRDDILKVSKIFISVFTVKSLLLLFSSFFFLMMVLSIKKFSNEKLVYIYTFLMVIGNFFSPVWLYQGLQKMKYITVINIVIKTLFIIPIFVFIHSKEDYLYYAIFHSSGYLISGIICFVLSYKLVKIKLMIPSYNEIKQQFIDGWHFYISTLSISIYTISNTFILGFFTSNSIVGYYSASEKIMKAFMGIMNPISQALYPHISYYVSQSRDKALNFIRKVFYLMGLSTLLFSSVTFIFADLIVYYILGNQYYRSVILLRILAFLPFIISLSNVAGIQTMLNFKMEKIFSRILMIASCLSIVLSLFLVHYFSDIGIAISTLATEIFVTISMFLYLNKKGIKIWKKQKILS